VQCCVEICELVNCDMRIIHKNLRILDLRTGTPKTFADLRNDPKNENF